MRRLKFFTFDGERREVAFVKTVPVAPGVICDEYDFVGDDSMDLAIVRVAPDHSTPLQEVLSGTRTVEGYRYGEGFFVVREEVDSVGTVYPVDGNTPQSFCVNVPIGALMQWHASAKGLCFSEVCEPRYNKTRFRVINEDSTDIVIKELGPRDSANPNGPWDGFLEVDGVKRRVLVTSKARGARRRTAGNVWITGFRLPPVPSDIAKRMVLERLAELGG